MDLNMDMVFKSNKVKTITSFNIKVNSNIIKKTDKESSQSTRNRLININNNIMVSLRMNINQEMELKHSPMEINIKDNII